MKKIIIIIFSFISLGLSSCTGTNKTNRVSDTSAAKGSGGPADSSKTAASPSSATTPGSSDTSSINKKYGGTTGDSSKKTP